MEVDDEGGGEGVDRSAAWTWACLHMWGVEEEEVVKVYIGCSMVTVMFTHVGGGGEGGGEGVDGGVQGTSVGGGQDVRMRTR